MLTVITELLPPLSTAIVLFLDKYDFFIKKNKVKKEELANWLIKVGEKIKYLADELSHDRYPHGVCGEINVYASEIRDMLIDYVDKDDVYKLEDQLRRCSNIEVAYHDFQGSSDLSKEHDLETLYFVAGTFIGRGEILKIK